MKLEALGTTRKIKKSRPSRGAWIEIKQNYTMLDNLKVAPLTGRVD